MQAGLDAVGDSDYLPPASFFAQGAVVGAMGPPGGGGRAVEAQGAAVDAICGADPGGRPAVAAAQGALVDGMPVALCICGLDIAAPVVAQGAFVPTPDVDVEELAGPEGTSILFAG